jgi:hypothetical protein
MIDCQHCRRWVRLTAAGTSYLYSQRQAFTPPDVVYQYNRAWEILRATVLLLLLCLASGPLYLMAVSYGRDAVVSPGLAAGLLVSSILLPLSVLIVVPRFAPQRFFDQPLVLMAGDHLVSVNGATPVLIRWQEIVGLSLQDSGPGKQIEVVYPGGTLVIPDSRLRIPLYVLLDRIAKHPGVNNAVVHWETRHINFS